MATNYIQPGDVIVVPAPKTLASGDCAKVGLIFGVAQTAAGSGDDVPLMVVGVHRVPKTSAQAWTVGAQIYWDDNNDECTTTDNNVPVGVAVAVANNPSATGYIRFTGQIVGTAMVGT